MAELTEEQAPSQALLAQAKAAADKECPPKGHKIAGYRPPKGKRSTKFQWIYQEDATKTYYRYDGPNLVEVSHRAYKWNHLANGALMGGPDPIKQAEPAKKRTAPQAPTSPVSPLKRGRSDGPSTKQKQLIGLLTIAGTGIDKWEESQQQQLASKFFEAYAPKADVESLRGQVEAAKEEKEKARQKCDSILEERRSDDPEILLRRVVDGVTWLENLGDLVLHKLNGGTDFDDSSKGVEGRACGVICDQLVSLLNLQGDAKQALAHVGITYDKELKDGEGRPDFVFHNCIIQDPRLRWPYGHNIPKSGRLFVEVKWAKTISKKLEMKKTDRDRLFGQIVGYFKDHAESEEGPFFAGLILVVVDANANSYDIKKLYETLRPYSLLMQAAARVSSPKNINVNVSLSVATISPSCKSDRSGREKGQGYYISPQNREGGTYE